MLDDITKTLGRITSGLMGKRAVNEKDVDDAMVSIRGALIDADIALIVVDGLLKHIKDKILAAEIRKKDLDGPMIVNILHEELCSILGSKVSELHLPAQPSVIMMVGLQGAGKTSSSAKIAHYVKNKKNKKVLLVSLDVYRPAAQEQLKILADSNQIDCLDIVSGEKPLKIVDRALKLAPGYDVVIFDTAGRLHIDGDMMKELELVHKTVKPSEVIFVADAMMGQDASLVAQEFDRLLKLTGIMVTRMDGDSNGGALLSMACISNCPVKFLVTGEKVSDIELFHPDRMARRIIGGGDLESMLEKASENIQEKDAEDMAKRLESGSFNLEDMLKQLSMIAKMGGMSGIMKYMPGASALQDKMGGNYNEDSIKKSMAVIRSMTPRERRFPKLLNLRSRKERIARGAGVTVQDIMTVIRQFEQMVKMMQKAAKVAKSFGIGGGGLSGLKGLKDLDMSKFNINDLMSKGLK